MSDMRKSRPQAGKVQSKTSSAMLAGMVAAFSQARQRAHQAHAEETLDLKKKLKPRAHERPTTMPRHPNTGEAISEDRRRKRRIKAAYREETGRRMNAKAFKRERRLAQIELPAALAESKAQSEVRSLFRGGLA